MNGIRVLALLALAPLAMAKSGTAQLVLRVIDGAQVPAATLQKAMKRVQWAFQAAGLEMRWLSTCAVDAASDSPRRTACEQSAPGVANVLEICILGAVGVAENARADVLGVANVASHRAYVLWNRIRTSELAKAIPDDKALALVMLHEAGHIAGLSHSPSGVMRSELCAASASTNAGAAGVVTFSPSEAAQIRRIAAGASPRTPHKNVQDEDDRNR